MAATEDDRHGAEPGSPHAGAAGRRDALLAWGLFLILCLVYTACAQEAYWSDGRTLVRLVSEGHWSYFHALYLPVAQIFRPLTSWIFGGDLERTLKLLSAVATAAAVALFYLSGRTLGLRQRSAVGGALLFAAAPSVWFYATTIEIHALQLLVAAGALLWAVRAQRAGRLGRDLLVPMLFLCGLMGTHLSGLMCAPALLACAFLGQGEPRIPRRVLPGLLVVLACCVGWYVMHSGASAPFRNFETAASGVFTRFKPSMLWRGPILSSGLFYFLFLPACLYSLRTEPRVFRRPLALAAALLIAAFLPFAMAFILPERGAYFLCALPVIAITVVRGLERLGALAAPLFLALVPVHVAWSLRDVWVWQHDYPGAEWAVPLVEEAEGQGLVIARYNWERAAIRLHSQMAALSPSVNLQEENVPAVERAVLAVVRETRRLGLPVFLLRSLYESDEPRAEHLVEQLVEMCGEPRPGRHPAYLVFP
jgi:hypothetical protein